MMRWLLVAVLCLLAGAVDARFPRGAQPQFVQAKIGAGGFSVGIDIAPDGTKAVRTDTYGAYVYNPNATNPGNAGGSGVWQQVVTSSLPAQQTLGDNAGVWEIAIAPSNANHIYMVFNGDVFSSTNKGANWTLLSNFTLDASATLSENSACRWWGRFMAVDPANENIVVLGSQTHLYYTLNGGTSWTTISTATIPAPTPAFVAGSTFNAAYEIVFDPTTTSAGSTPGIYVMASGAGVYHTTGGPAGSWTLTSSGPTDSYRLAIGADGVVWATGAGAGCGDPATTTNLWRFQSSAWTNLTTVSSNGQKFHGVAPDPNNAGHVYAVGADGGLNYTANNGTFAGIITGPGQTATDIPWLANGAGNNNTFMDAAEARIDPSNGSLWIATGAAVWMVAAPPTTQTAFTWTSVSSGLEQLVVDWIISPWTAGSTPRAFVADKQEFPISTSTYPSAHGLASPSGSQIMWSSGADWASSSPCNLVALGYGNTNGSQNNSQSSDCGATWTNWANSPTGYNTTGAAGLNGSIAASTPTNWVLAPNNNATNIFYTLNGATTAWLTASGLPSGASGAYGFASFLVRHIVCADRVAANTFYILSNTTASATAGIYKSTNGGANWTLQPATGGYIDGNQGNQNFNATLKCSPKTSGDLWYTSGWQGSGGPSSNLAPSGLYHSTDGGAHWTAISNLLVGNFGFGAPQSAGGNPTIYAAGTLSGVQGLYRSTDLGVSWVSVGSLFPLGSFDLINTIEGDANTYGRVYIGYAGSGVIVGQNLN